MGTFVLNKSINDAKHILARDHYSAKIRLIRRVNT